MIKTIETLEYLKKFPIFNNLIIKNRFGKNNRYTNLFIHRLSKKGLIYKIERNKYTLLKDPFLISSRIIWPSYISCWSALSHHHLTEQIPHDIFVIITKNKKQIKFNNTKIVFLKLNPKFFFGYNKINYEQYEIFIADAEKSIIDSALLRKVSFSEIKDIIKNNIKKIEINKFIKYLEKIGNKSLIKRFGYVFDQIGKDYHKRLEKYIDHAYIKLDYNKKPVGKKNDKWRLIIND